MERLIDDYTPYQKANLDALSPQQQRVIDAIALNWNPCDVATVSRATRLPSNQVSAQIRALVKSGILLEATAVGTGKKKAYLLTDRFSNIHYLMRHGRSGRYRMHWYIMTLRMLYDDQDFAYSTAKLIKLGKIGHGLKKGEAAFLACSALDSAGSEDARRMLMDGLVELEEFDETESEELCRKAVQDHPGDMYAHFKLGRLLFSQLKQFQEAKVHFTKAFELDSEKTEPLIFLGLASAKLGEFSESEKYYHRALELNPKLVEAWNCLGILNLENWTILSRRRTLFEKQSI